MTHPIEKIIDDNSIPYAYAYMTKARDSIYGHMEIILRFTSPQHYSRPDGVIKITCQIGSDDPSCGGREAPYAQTYGFDPRYGKGSLPELEQAVKMMRKIERSLNVANKRMGRPTTFAMFAHRVILASGMKHMIAESFDGWANGGLMRDKELYTVGAKSLERLEVMEESLIAAFCTRLDTEEA